MSGIEGSGSAAADLWQVQQLQQSMEQQQSQGVGEAGQPVQPDGEQTGGH